MRRSPFCCAALARVVFAAILAITPPVALAQTPVNPQAVGPSQGLTAKGTDSTATSVVVKAAPGNFYDAYGTNNTGSTVFIYLFNRTTAPTNGAVVFGTASGDYQDCFAVPTGSSQGIVVAGSPGEPFSVGVVLAASSTSCGTLTLAAIDFMKARVK